MRPESRSAQLLHDIPPPRAALQRELRITVGVMLGQPAPQRLARCRTDLAPAHQPVAVHVIKRDLLSVHVQAAYHRHRDLLELLKQLV